LAGTSEVGRVTGGELSDPDVKAEGVSWFEMTRYATPARIDAIIAADTTTAIVVLAELGGRDVGGARSITAEGATALGPVTACGG
jgi:hypothetical protein